MAQDDNFLNTLYTKKGELAKQMEAIDKAILEFGGQLDSINHTHFAIESIITATPALFEIPASYNDELTWEEKTIYGLYRCPNKTGFVTDIISALTPFDKTIHKENQKAFAAITTKASILGRRGWFNRKNVNGRFKYTLK